MTDLVAPWVETPARLSNPLALLQDPHQARLGGEDNPWEAVDDLGCHTIKKTPADSHVPYLVWLEVVPPDVCPVRDPHIVGHKVQDEEKESGSLITHKGSSTVSEQSLKRSQEE